MAPIQVHGGADGAYVIFTEHVPTEFEATSHYLRNAAGEDVEPVAQEPPEDDHDHDHDHNG